MVNELVKIELTNETGFPRRYTVASGTAITKGSLLKIEDDRVASSATGDQEPIAGVASMAKSATDFSTSISVWTDGIFKAVASGSITFGNPLSSAGVNELKTASGGFSDTASGARTIGYALETVTNGETFQARIRT